MFKSEQDFTKRTDQNENLDNEISEEDMKKADPLIPVFGIELVKMIFANDWHIRE